MSNVRVLQTPPPQICRDHSAWRLYMARELAAEMDMHALGVKALYLFGSVEEETAGPGSDMDLLLHVEQPDYSPLSDWLECWNDALCALCEQLTGLRPDYMLDIHLVTDEDIAQKRCFAARIASPWEPAMPLRIRAAAN